jgi:hypothetical protein
MCGEGNPADAEICMYCQARIKPLTASLSAEEPTKSQPEEGLPDWLDDLRADQDSGSTPPGVEPVAGSTEELLQWLDEDTPIEPLPPQEIEGDEVPEWLENIRASEAERKSAEAEAISEQDAGDDDWLERIRHSESEPAPSSFESTPAPHPAEEDDWLRELREDQEVESLSDQSVIPEQDDGAEDWMERIRSLKADDGLEEPEVRGDLDWLSGLEDDTPQKEEESSEWISEFGAQVPGTEAETEATDQEQEETAPEQPGEEAIPGWLEEVKGVKPGETPVEGTTTGWLSEGELEAEIDEGEEVPDWLPKFEDDEDAVLHPLELTPEEKQAPEWLAESYQPVDVIPSLEGDESPEKTTLPDEGDQLVETPTPPAPTSVEDEKELEPEIQDDVVDAAAIVDAEFPGLPKEPGEPAESFPSWLADLQESVPEMLDDSIEAPITPAFDADTDEDEEFELEELELEEIELPDWISEMRPSASSGDEDETLPEGEETIEIAPGELPGWLQVMRPDGSALPGEIVEEDADEETIGPLAGLRGVLPAEPEIVQFGKPPVFSIKLQVSDSQVIHANVFENTIKEEVQPLSIKRRPIALPQHILRWLIAVILVIALIPPILMESQNVPLPGRFPPAEIQAVLDLVSLLPPTSPVLLAFDYQPGLSGEMDSAASAVVDHLLIKGAQLVIMSTNPTGPALAERFLHSTQSDHGYVAEKEYRNLGYISGNTSALLHFAQSPRSALPITEEKQDGVWSVWDLPPLENINALADFTLVVVITDDPDVARSWIEQVEPELDDTPLIMVLSAQAKPLVYPYFTSVPKQVNGIVSGVVGGAFYERGIGRYSLSRKYWDSFNNGLTVSVFILLFGGAYSLAVAGFERLRKGRSKEG